MSAWLDALSPDERTLVRKTARPDWLVPMAATLTKDRFTDAGWIYEQKLDGIRYVSFVANGTAQMLTRNRIQHHHPDVEAALVSLASKDFIVDGEMVAHVGERSGFGLRGVATAQLAYHVFDVMRLDGYDVTQLPLVARRALLQSLDLSPPLRRVDELPIDGVSPYERACASGWEGVIAKRRESVYEHRRSPAWLKMKCEATQELVVGGFTDPRGARESLGALLVGYYDGDDLVYAGKVGTGFDTKLLRELYQRLHRSEIEKPPFTRGGGLPRKGAHWVRPQLVVQVAFTEWTSDDKMRHPHFLGLREDKAAKDVVRES